MGSLGPRQFVPPFADPIAPNVHPLVWRVTSHLGTLMSLRLEQNGHRGVVSGWTFDGNWIGGTRNTGWWKNVFGVLTETASAALAAPIDIDSNELRGGGKGLVDYRQQVNFPNPWPGGRWGLADAVAYQLDVMGAFVEFAATYRGDVLGFVAEMAESAVARGRDEAPRSFIVPPSPADPRRARRLVELLVEGGAEGYLAPDGVTANGAAYPPGSVVFPAAQPLRQFLVEVTRRQRYPEISPAPGAEPLLPYDITAWTLPLYLGANVVEAEGEPIGRLNRFDGAPAWPAAAASGEGSVVVLPAGQLDAVPVANRALARGLEVRRLTTAAEIGGSRFEPGSLAIAGGGADLLDGAAVTARRTAAMPAAAAALRRVAVGVYHPDFGLEDAGWLRFVLENAGFPVEVVDNRAFRTRGWHERLGVLLLPALDGKTLVEGGRRPAAVPMPADYRGGIGKDGIEAIRSFLASGGTVVAFSESAAWLAEALELPVTDTLKGVGRSDFYCPGSLLSLDLDASSPLAWGMPARVAAMVEGGSAFQTRPVGGDERRAVVARYPEEPLLQSGWIRGEERLQRRAAEVELRRGQGRVVLFAFAPHFRGQSAATFLLLYNAVLAEMSDPAPSARPARGKP
ncbi:MAG: peptidase carboxypeptidase [Acidobacteria bacterium]|nr:peptidase carboxypeptidase [Acidobacteriota bacterium]